MFRKSIFEKPILDTDDAHKVVVRNRDGIPAIALFKVNNGGWGVSMATDGDWGNVCKLYGIE